MAAAAGSPAATAAAHLEVGGGKLIVKAADGGKAGDQTVDILARAGGAGNVIGHGQTLDERIKPQVAIVTLVLIDRHGSLPNGALWRILPRQDADIH
jgi:hypothetical protein